MRPRTKPVWRVVQAVGAFAVVCAFATSCGGSGGVVRSALSSGIREADVAFSGYVDDFATLTRKSAIEIPPELDDAVRQADDAVRAGTQLTEEERALLATGERWVAALKGLDEILQMAIGWEANIPEDAVHLVNARLWSEPSVAFSTKIRELEQKVLKGLMCQVARDALDEIGRNQAETSTPNYVWVGHENRDVEAYMWRELVDFSGVSDVLDVAGLANESIKLANEYVEGINSIIESPDETIAAANVIYFRSCVIR